MCVGSASYHWKIHYYVIFLSAWNLSEVPKFAGVHILYIFIYLHLYLYIWCPELYADCAALYYEDSGTVFLVLMFWLKFQKWLVSFPACSSSHVSEKKKTNDQPKNLSS